MAIIKQQVKKQMALETIPMVRLLASGTKLTDATMSAMKLKAGIAQEKDDSGKITTEGKAGDIIHYGKDDKTGQVYLYKAEEGAVIGSTKTFTSSGLKAEMLRLADGQEIKDEDGKVVGTVKPGIELEGGLQIRFNVSTTPVDDEFYEVTFRDAIIVPTKKNDEESEEGTKEVATKEAPKAKSEDWES